MHLGFGDASRLDALVQTIVYLIGVPIFIDNGDVNQTIVANSTFDTGLSESSFTVRYQERKGYNLTANPLEEVLPTICLYTKAQINTCQVVIEGSPLEVSNGSNFWITHGYIENGKRPWIQDMMKELFHYDNFANVFVIDWSEASKPPYNQAVENLEMIAAYCANLMIVLQKAYDIQINETHFIGHSLGAHLGGYLGSWLKEHHDVQIGRISGLDPAQLYFQGLPVDARLDPSDGIFVDVIHTDAKPFLNGGEIGYNSKSSPSRPVSGLGTQEPSGHADFYPNGGKDQPGCKDGVYQAILQEEGSVINGIRRFLGCDHIRSYEYFTESIRSPCSFMAFACESWQEFAESTCNIVDYNKLGFHATKPQSGNQSSANVLSSQVYYSITGPRPPFCREHYKVTIRLAEESKYRSTSELHLVLGSNGNVNGATTVLNLGQIDFTGTNLTRKYTVSGINNGFPNTITLRPSSSNPLRWLMNKMATPSDPDVIVANVTVSHLESLDFDNNDAVFCAEDKNYFRATEQNPSITFSRDRC